MFEQAISKKSNLLVISVIFISPINICASVYIRDLNIKRKIQFDKLFFQRLNKLGAKYSWFGRPGWNENLKISSFAKRFQRYFNKNLVLTFVNGGVEPKNLLNHVPSFKSGISYGVNITSPHSQSERVR
ncbi:MAG: hypothetical protein LBF00_00545 [Mycoplasmataceae bacterium]|jgi:hypothetical protein|nr:hypothetical protein [Mycoplasmataceae bacterium]